MFFWVLGLQAMLVFILCCPNISPYSKMSIHKSFNLKKGKFYNRKKDGYHLKPKEVINGLICLLTICFSYCRTRSHKEMSATVPMFKRHMSILWTFVVLVDQYPFLCLLKQHPTFVLRKPSFSDSGFH